MAESQEVNNARIESSTLINIVSSFVIVYIMRVGYRLIMENTSRLSPFFV